MSFNLPSLDNLPAIPWAKIMGNTRKRSGDLDVQKIDVKRLKEFLELRDQLYGKTPDAVERENEANLQAVFLYCNQMPGQGLASMIDSVRLKYSPQGYTEELFNLYRHNLGKDSFPIALRFKDSWHPPARVKGRIVFLSSQHLNVLDNTKGNGVLFTRNLKPINIIRHRLERGPHGVSVVEEVLDTRLAWMYIGISKHWKNIIDGGYEYTPAQPQFAKRRSYVNMDLTHYEFQCPRSRK